MTTTQFYRGSIDRLAHQIYSDPENALLPQLEAKIVHHHDLVPIGDPAMKNIMGENTGHLPSGFTEPLKAIYMRPAAKWAGISEEEIAKEYKKEARLEMFKASVFGAILKFRRDLATPHAYTGTEWDATRDQQQLADLNTAYAELQLRIKVAANQEGGLNSGLIQGLNDTLINQVMERVNNNVSFLPPAATAPA